jgi:hypothetical protein
MAWRALKWGTGAVKYSPWLSLEQSQYIHSRPRPLLLVKPVHMGPAETLSSLVEGLVEIS